MGCVLTVGYPAYAVFPPWFARVRWVGMAKASSALTTSFRPVRPMTDYTSRVSAKHLMYMCFPHVSDAHPAVPLRHFVHPGACGVGTAAFTLCC